MSESKKDSSQSSLVGDLLKNENLKYVLPAAATVIVEKNSKQYFADNNTYTSGGTDRIIFTLNSGSDFIQAKNSYLSFNLKVNAHGGDGSDESKSATFGAHGSACNLFSEIVIRSRDSSEVERIRGLNSLIASQLKWNYAKDYLNHSASMFGYRGDADAAGVSALNQTVALKPGPGDTGGLDVVIPMALLSGLFQSEKLLPSFLMSGLRIELVLEKVSTVFQCGANAVITDYTITDPTIRLETCKVSDSIMNALTQSAANDGLVLPIQTWDLTQGTTGTSSLNMEVRRNISQCLGVVVKNRATPNITAVDADSMASEEKHAVASYRFRLGAQFIPSSVVTNKMEQYALANIAFNKFKAVYAENAVNSTGYLTGGHGLVASDLERSALELSGQAISNSRILAYEGKFGTPGARTIDLYIQFTRVITVFLSNVLVEE